MSPCIKPVVAFTLALTAISIPGVAEASRTEDPGLEGQLDALEIHEGPFTRSKRQVFEINPDMVGGKDPYRNAPDFWPNVPSPAPGVSLNDIIYETNDGKYHGASRRYKGDAGNVLATTQRKSEEFVTMSVPDFTLNNMESLRLIMSEINRLKMLKTSSPETPRVTTPVYAKYFDPNWHKFPLMFSDTRRMYSESDNMKLLGEIPPKVRDFLKQKVQYKGMHEVGPFKYDPETFADFDKWTHPTPISVIPYSDRPLEVFKYKYGTTTKRRPRTRRSKAKTTTTISIKPMKDDEYIPEETDLDDEDTTLQSSSQSQGIPLMEKKLKDDFVDDTKTTNTKHTHTKLNLSVNNKTKSDVGRPGLLKLKTEEDTQKKIDTKPNEALNIPEYKVPYINKPETESELIDPEIIEDIKIVKQMEKKTNKAPQTSFRRTDVHKKKLLKNILADPTIINKTGKKLGEMTDDLKLLLTSDEETDYVSNLFQLPKGDLDPDDNKWQPFHRRRRGKNIAKADAVGNSTDSTVDTGSGVVNHD